MVSTPLTPNKSMAVVIAVLTMDNGLHRGTVKKCGERDTIKKVVDLPGQSAPQFVRETLLVASTGFALVAAW